MPDTYLSVMPRPRPRPDSAALAAAWGKRANPDSRNWARRQVEKIRAAWGAGRLQLPPWIDNYTEETPEIREAYHGLLSEPMVKAGYGSKVWAVAALDCNVVPADPDDARHKQAATAFKWVLSQVGMGSKNGRPVGTQLIAWEVLSGACINGWSLCELVGGDVARRGPAAGKEYWRDIKAKDTRRLSPVVDEFKNVVAIRSWLAGARTWEGSDLDSFVTYAHWPLYCSPNGMSDFRAVYRAACIKDAAMRLRALGLDRWTHPYLRGVAATDEQKDAIAAALEDARGNGYVVLPPGAMVDAVQLATSSDDVFHNAIQDLDREILIGISWSHLPMQEGQTTGGRGDTEVQQGTAELGQWALASVLGGVVTGQMARPWYERNYGDIEPGTVVWGAVNEKALLTSAQLDEALLKIGVKLSRKERQNYYGRAAPADDGDSLAPPGQGPQPPPGQPPPAGGPPGLPFAEDFDAFCTEGKNAGKPGPCPEGGAGAAPKKVRVGDVARAITQNIQDGAHGEALRLWQSVPKEQRVQVANRLSPGHKRQVIGASLAASGPAAGPAETAHGPKPPAALPDFAREVAGVAAATKTGGFGDNKVFISHVYKGMAARYPGLSPGEFKGRLLEAANAGLVTLSRADLVQLMNPEDVLDSEVKHPSGVGEFHFILSPGQREQTRFDNAAAARVSARLLEAHRRGTHHAEAGTPAAPFAAAPPPGWDEG